MLNNELFYVVERRRIFSSYEFVPLASSDVFIGCDIIDLFELSCIPMLFFVNDFCGLSYGGFPRRVLKKDCYSCYFFRFKVLPFSSKRLPISSIEEIYIYKLLHSQGISYMRTFVSASLLCFVFNIVVEKCEKC